VLVVVIVVLVAVCAVSQEFALATCDKSADVKSPGADALAAGANAEVTIPHIAKHSAPTPVLLNIFMKSPPIPFFDVAVTRSV